MLNPDNTELDLLNEDQFCIQLLSGGKASDCRCDTSCRISKHSLKNDVTNDEMSLNVIIFLNGHQILYLD